MSGMQSHPVMVSLALGCTVACAPIDGQIFATVTGGSASGSTASADAGSDAESSDAASSGGQPMDCLDAESVIYEGNDPRFAHDCGEPCDSDWCSCEPCRAVAGSLGRLPVGSHRLLIEGGASGTIDYTLTVRLDSGEVLAERSFSYDGLFVDETEFIVPEDCASVEVEWVQHSDLCSRVYELIVETP